MLIEAVALTSEVASHRPPHSNAERLWELT